MPNSLSPKFTGIPYYELHKHLIYQGWDFHGYVDNNDELAMYILPANSKATFDRLSDHGWDVDVLARNFGGDPSKGLNKPIRLMAGRAADSTGSGWEGQAVSANGVMALLALEGFDPMPTEFPGKLIAGTPTAYLAFRRIIMGMADPGTLPRLAFRGGYWAPLRDDAFGRGLLEYLGLQG